MSDVGFASPINAPRKNGEMASYGNDSGLHVTFYQEKVYMGFESEKQGKPVYEWRPYVHIITPGAKTDMKRPVREFGIPGSGIPSDPERFPRQWQAFKNQQEQAQSGMPLEEWSPLPRQFVEEFKASRIHSVEQLAALHDGNANGMPLEWRKWRDKAVAWLKSAEDKAPMLALQSENDTLKSDMAALKEQMALLLQGQGPLPEKRKPGRPPKVLEEGTEQ